MSNSSEVQKLILIAVLLELVWSHFIGVIWFNYSDMILLAHNAFWLFNSILPYIPAATICLYGDRKSVRVLRGATNRWVSKLKKLSHEILTHTHANTHTHTHTHTTHAHTHTHTHTHAHTHRSMHTNMHPPTRTHTHTHTVRFIHTYVNSSTSNLRCHTTQSIYIKKKIYSFSSILVSLFHLLFLHHFPLLISCPFLLSLC